MPLSIEDRRRILEEYAELEKELEAEEAAKAKAAPLMSLTVDDLEEDELRTMEQMVNEGLGKLAAARLNKHQDELLQGFYSEMHAKNIRKGSREMAALMGAYRAKGLDFSKVQFG